MKMQHHPSVLSRICNGLSGLVTRFGRKAAASNSAKTSSVMSPSFDSDNMKCVLQQPNRGSSSATASTIKIKTSLASGEFNAAKSPTQPLRKATEEHTCPPPSTCVDDVDISYQRFLDFLKTPSGSTPLQNQCGPSTNSTEGQEQPIIEQNCLQGQGVSREEENSNVIEHLYRGEEEDAASLSICNFVELEDTDPLPCLEKDALSSSKDVDSAMAWCALAAVLGCKAPSSVTKQVGGKIKQKEQLWEMDDTPSEDIPDLPFDDGSFFSENQSASESAPDLNEISFDESDDDEDSLFIVPDLDVVQDFSCEDTCHKTDVKEAADSTLTWSALALLLGAPAPASVLKRSRKVSRVSDEALSELVPSLH